MADDIQWHEVQLLLLVQVDIKEGGRLQMEVAAATVAAPQSGAAKVAAAFPDWCSVAASEVFHFSWQL